MADQLLPVEDTAKEYYRVTKKNGDKETKLREQLTPSEVYAVDENNGKVKYSDYPQFTVNNGKVKVTGSSQYINSDIVNSTAKLIQDYYKGYDLSNNQVAESLQKSLDEVNKQIKANIQYQEYNNFLNSSGFSDQAYRNYVKAKEDADPKTNTNLLKNKNKYKGFKKDGTLTSDDEAMTAAEWFEYWKKNYTPEERIQLWLDSNSALSNAASDDDLYKALPYILMGAEEKQNVPAGIMNAVNPFNKEGYDDAKFYGPINGFEDVNSWDAFWDAFASTNKEALGSFVKWAGGSTTPLERALGPRYVGKNISTPEEWGKTNGLKDVTYETIGNMSREEWNRIADKVNDYFFNTNKEVRNRRLEGGTDAEILEKYEGAEDAAKILFVRDFSVLKGGRDQGWDLYQNYRDLYNLQQTEGYKSPYEKWGAEKEKAMQEHIGRLNTIAPTSTTLGVIGGTLARHLAEQAALSLMTGGALTASNIASKLASGGWKLGSNLMTKIGLGQKIAASHPALASAIHAMATSTATYAAGGKLADTAFKAGMTVADGAGTAAKVIYVLGSVGNWAVRELGEDAIRGIVDDAITGNSLDSQGNLDADKFLENVYMNAIMYGALKGIKGGVKGISSLVDNARTRDIDGVELNATQRSQLDLFQKALDDQNDKYKLSGYDGSNHPVITINGKNKVLDEVTLSENTAKAVEEATGVVAPTAARTVENILDDDRVPDATKQKIAEVLEENRVDVNNGKELTPDELKTKLQEKLSDDEIRQAFPDGTMKVGDQTVKITPKEFTSGDIGRVTGKEFSNMNDAINGLKVAETTSDFASSVNGIMRGSTEFATNFKNAVEEFANDHNMNVRDVMIAIRDSRIAGEETIPGLRELWENNWKPVQEKLLDLQEQITGVRPASHDFYFRDMIEGTFKPSASGAWSIDQGSVTDMLGGDADFDLAASSFARNTGKLADMASDKLEYDPEVLAREFVASRIQTIWESDKGKIFTTLQEAHDAGEFDLTEAEAARSVTATEQVGREVGESDGVKTIENLSNVESLGPEFGADDAKRISDDIKDQEKQVSKAEKAVEAANQKLKDANKNYRMVQSQEYGTEQIHTPETERIKIDIANKTGEDLDELPFNILDDQNSSLIRMLDETPGTVREGNLRNYKKSGGMETRVILADPASYNRVLLNDSKSNTDAETIERISWDGKTHEYKQAMQDGDKFPTPYIKYKSDGSWDGQEGRHRATAAEFAGLSKIPIIVSLPLDDTLEAHGFKNYDDITDDVAKLVTENHKARMIDTKVADAQVKTAEKGVAAAEARLADEKQTLSELKTRKPEKTVTIQTDGDTVKTSTGKTGEAAVEEMADLSKKQIVNAQKKFNESAAKSTSAEQISRTSGYKKRGNRVNAGPVVGVNYMPSNPFGKFAKWINDHFVKANSIKMVWKNANGEVTGSVTAYNGGYKMYAEAGSFARNVIVDIQNGANLWESIYKQVRDNGFFIEPTEYQKATYGALDASEQAARVTDKIMDRMTRGNYYYKWSDAFNDDGTVKNTEAVLSILTTRFRGQGINDFTKFIRKADWDSFSKEEQSWLNKRMYEMTASVNKKSMKNIITLLAKNSMGLRYKSNMWFNYKNAQLQLTEIQRLYTMNKIGDFGRTLKRLVSDSDYRQKVSDYTYIHAAESMGRGLSRQDLETTVDAMTKVGAGSTMSKSGMFTDIDTIKAKFGEINDDALAAIEGAEYTKNFMLIAGFVAAGEKQGLEGLDLDNYVRNRFNTEALAGTKVGKIGLTDSKIGQFAFMYLGFPIRELTLQWHTIRGGGIRGNVLGSLEYMAKMLGAKGLMWAVEAPWGYSLLDQLDVDPFGFAEQYDQVNTPYEDREPGWRNLDFALQYNPFFQGAMTSAMTDIYFSYRAAEEAAREAYKEEHGGSTDGFEWSLADAGAEMWTDLLKGLTPGYTAYSRAEGEITDLDRGYRTSQTGNRMYETNTDLYNIMKGFLAGRRTTANAQDYYQMANPIRGLAENGLGGLGQQIERGLEFNPLKLLEGKNPFRGFREFDPIDPDTYTDWFNGTYRDQQNWNTGIYAFKEEAQQIKEKYDRYANEGTAINSMASRENELADLRKRVEKYVKAYTDRHPEGISNSKQNQIINIFNLGSYQPTLDQAFQEAQGNTDYSDWEAAKNRYSQGDFPTAYGIKESDDGSDYARSPQLEQVLSQHRYGIASDVAPVLEQMYTTQEFDTPLGRMTMKDYHDKVYSQLQDEWNKSNTDYNKVSDIQTKYLETLSTNVIQPILNTYGSAVLSAGKSSDIMQEFGKMLYSMVPSDDYRIDKKGKKIYKSTPYMTIDIKAWLNKNFKDYAGNINTTNRQTTDRLTSIRDSINQGHQSTAKAKARALVQDIGKGKASVSRDELEWLQGILK